MPERPESKEQVINAERRPGQGRNEQGYAAPAAPPGTAVMDARSPAQADETSARPRDTVLPSPADSPRQGLLPPGSWGWKQALIGLLVGFGPALALALPGLGADAGQTAAVTTASAAALIFTSLLAYGWQTAAAWFFSLRGKDKDDSLSAWGFRRPTTAFFWAIPLALVVVYAVAYFHDLLVNPEQQEILRYFPHTPGGAALLAFLAVGMAPLFEELFFRGFLFRGLARSWGWPLGALVSGAAFGAIHLQLTVFFPLFVLGVALAWVYQKTGSLWTSITLHAVFNGISVIAWIAVG